MALRRWRGVLCIEGIQTGDGRVMAADALEWAPLPLPLAWIRDGDQHVYPTAAPQLGVIEIITREGSDLVGTGIIDDEIPEGAELIRRLQAGSAALGARVGLSIDPDNWNLEIVATDTGDEEGGIVILASAGAGATPRGWGWTSNAARESERMRFRSSMLSLVAAAGDPDPGEGGGETGVVLFTDAVDEILERYTRLRIRGVTACAVAAFDGAYLELDGEADAAPAEVVASANAIVTAAAGAPVPTPTDPPAAWFSEAEPTEDDDRMVEQFDQWGRSLGFACPLTITAEGQVYGHAAGSWDQQHVGFVGQRVTPPRSQTEYVPFHVGHVLCAGGEDIATGALIVGCDHAPDLDPLTGEPMSAAQARDHYANSGLGWADVRASNGVFGPWVAGALRPGLTEADLRVLRALTLSGDWRRHGRGLEMVAVLAVNTPGFPVARESLAASALEMVYDATARAYVYNGEITSLVAAAPVVRCADCLRRQRLVASLSSPEGMADALSSIQASLRTLDHRTAHLIPAAVDEVAASVVRSA